MFSLLKYNNFLKMIRLRVNLRNQIVDMFQSGENQLNISKILNIICRTARKV